ncbi:MAG: (2Fe-2S)-binding protein [Candidatus Poribacteria bacterium]
MDYELNLTVNGEYYRLIVPPYRTLLEVLREDLGLTGAKSGCSTGKCGACTVILDGKSVKSCLILALQANGKEVLTIEGLANGDKLHPLQKAFIEHGAMQCGYCTPGMILSAKALLDENLHPTEDEIRDALVGNICRCTGYVKIVEAISATVSG